MKKYLVSFYTKEFKDSNDRLKQSALKFGVDEFISFTAEDIKATDFYINNKAILDAKRGAGFWLWKPYIILKKLEQLNEGDILVYADSGIEIIESLDPLFNILLKRKSILTFSCGGYKNKEWIKRDCFILMGSDSEKYWNAEHRLGGFQLYMKNNSSIDFVKDWIRYAEDERIITDNENTQGLGNLEGFKNHRHDQSIFSLLADKNDLEIFRDPTQWGNFLKLPEFREPDEFLHHDYSLSPFQNSPYGTLLNLHRSRHFSIFNRCVGRIKKIPDYFRKILISAMIYRHKNIDGWLTAREASGLYSFGKKVPENGTVVEIGSWKGKSTYCLAKGTRSSVKIISIDPFDFSGEPGSREEYEKRKNGMAPVVEFKKNMSRLGVIDKIEIKKGLSKDFINQIKEIDLLFIDGDHSVEGCKFDFENYGPKIKSGGYLLFHDYDPKRKTLGPTWVIDNLVILSNNFKKIQTFDSLCIFKKK